MTHRSNASKKEQWIQGWLVFKQKKKEGFKPIIEDSSKTNAWPIATRPVLDTPCAEREFIDYKTSLTMH